MRDIKYTPGPWVAVEADFAGGKHYGVSPCENLSLGIAVTGLVGVGVKADVTSQANANLIAASPELLESCEKFMAGVDAHADEELKSRLSYHLSNMSKAIKKAYGETP